MVFSEEHVCCEVTVLFKTARNPFKPTKDSQNVTTVPLFCLSSVMLIFKVEEKNVQFQLKSMNLACSFYFYRHSSFLKHNQLISIFPKLQQNFSSLNHTDLRVLWITFEHRFKTFGLMWGWSFSRMSHDCVQFQLLRQRSFITPQKAQERNDCSLNPEAPEKPPVTYF